jgi:hypothetical protein
VLGHVVPSYLQKNATVGKSPTAVLPLCLIKKKSSRSARVRCVRRRISSSPPDRIPPSDLLLVAGIARAMLPPHDHRRPRSMRPWTSPDSRRHYPSVSRLTSALADLVPVCIGGNLHSAGGGDALRCERCLGRPRPSVHGEESCSRVVILWALIFFRQGL